MTFEQQYELLKKSSEELAEDRTYYWTAADVQALLYKIRVLEGRLEALERKHSK